MVKNAIPNTACITGREHDKLDKLIAYPDLSISPKTLQSDLYAVNDKAVKFLINKV